MAQSLSRAAVTVLLVSLLFAPYLLEVDRVPSLDPMALPPTTRPHAQYP